LGGDHRRHLHAQRLLALTYLLLAGLKDLAQVDHDGEFGGAIAVGPARGPPSAAWQISRNSGPPSLARLARR
jgi:hypothetical protein